MSEQADFGFWPSVVSPLKLQLSDINQDRRRRRQEYAIVTPEIIAEIFDKRLLVAGLLGQSGNKTEAFWARLMVHTLTQIRKELEDRI